MAQLNDVIIEQQDGGLGNNGGSSVEGVHVKIGPATGVNKNQVVIISGPDDVESKIGSGVLADRLLDALSSGCGMIYAIIAAASTVGTNSTVIKTGTGKATSILSGTPNNDYDVKIKIVKGGALNEAACQISLDGGDSYGIKKVIPTSGILVIDGTDLTLTFTAGAPTSESFIEGDYYTFTSSAPKMSNQDFLTAYDVAKNIPFNYEYIHVCGETSSALWTLCESEAQTLFTGMKRPIFFICEARNKTSAETLDQYVTAMITEKGSFTGIRTAVVAGRGELAAADGKVRDSNIAAVLTGILSRAKVSESPGKVRKFPMPLMTDLRPISIKDAHIALLDEAGFITARRYLDYAGFYITNFRMMAVSTSDFVYGEVRRTADKISRLVRKASLAFMQFEGDESGITMYQAALEQPLRDMAKENVREILGYSVIIPPGQNLLSDPEIDAEIAFVPVPIMRSMRIIQKVKNPFLER